MTEDEIKSLLKKIKKLKKEVKKDKRNTFFLATMLPLEEAYEYLIKEHKYVMEALKKEKIECSKILHDEKIAKHVWGTKKQNKQAEELWADKAYPKQNIQLFELEYAEIYLKELI